MGSDWTSGVRALPFAGLLGLAWPGAAPAVERTTEVGPNLLMVTDRFASATKAKRACYAFAEEMGYRPEVACLSVKTHGGVLLQVAGWLRADGPEGVSSRFYYLTYYFCALNQQYDDVQKKCLPLPPPRRLLSAR